MNKTIVSIVVSAVIVLAVAVFINSSFTGEVTRAALTSMCKDSDSGIDYANSGFVAISTSSDYRRFFDHCNGITWMQEAACDSPTTRYASFYAYDCATDGKICCEGACVPSSTSCVDPCDDTDGGNSTKVKGLCTDSSGSHEDSCWYDVRHKKWYVTEYSCGGTQCYEGVIPCPRICANGLCR